MEYKVICNQLYRNLFKTEYLDKIYFLSDEECETGKTEHSLDCVEMAILQPYYVRKRLLDKMPQLKYIQVTGAGYDQADLTEIIERKITLANTCGVMSKSIAEDVFAKILFFTRRLRTVEEDRKNHYWNYFGQNQWMCSCYVDLYGKTIGILGAGSIGLEVAKRAKAFDMKVCVYARNKKESAYIDKCYCDEDGLKELYAVSDVIVVSLPLNNSTRHMISEIALKQMKKSVIIINVARGPIIDTFSLVAALKRGDIAGAALDVFEQEPLPIDSELWEIPNLFISSHKAGMGDSWKNFMGRLLMHNVDSFYLHGTIDNVVQL